MGVKHQVTYLLIIISSSTSSLIFIVSLVSSYFLFLSVLRLLHLLLLFFFFFFSFFFFFFFSFFLFRLPSTWVPHSVHGSANCVLVTRLWSLSSRTAKLSPRASRALRSVQLAQCSWVGVGPAGCDSPPACPGRHSWLEP